MPTPALHRALELLARPGDFELELPAGARDAPKRWALTTFGAESRPLVRSARGHSEIRRVQIFSGGMKPPELRRNREFLRAARCSSGEGAFQPSEGACR